MRAYHVRQVVFAVDFVHKQLCESGAEARGQVLLANIRRGVHARHQPEVRVSLHWLRVAPLREDD